MPRSTALRRVLAVAVVLLCTASVLPAAAVTNGGNPGDVVARATSTSAAIGNDRIRRTWKIQDGAVVTTGLVDVATRRGWSTTASPDFRTDGRRHPDELHRGLAPARRHGIPDPATASQLLFRYLRDVAGSSALPLIGLELDRLVVLRAGSSVLEITSTLRSDAARVARVSSYSLDEVTTTRIRTTEVQAYHGGTDWRDDYRVPKTIAGTFDEEGEVARLDDGTGAGLFFVTERRGHVASRVGRDAQGRSWAGVDLAGTCSTSGRCGPTHRTTTGWTTRSTRCRSARGCSRRVKASGSGGCSPVSTPVARRRRPSGSPATSARRSCRRSPAASG